MANESFPSNTREQLAKRPRQVAAWVVLVLMVLAAGGHACTPGEEETAEGIEQETAEGIEQETAEGIVFVRGGSFRMGLSGSTPTGTRNRFTR